METAGGELHQLEGAIEVCLVFHFTSSARLLSREDTNFSSTPVPMTGLRSGLCFAAISILHGTGQVSCCLKSSLLVSYFAKELNPSSDRGDGKMETLQRGHNASQRQALGAEPLQKGLIKTYLVLFQQNPTSRIYTSHPVRPSAKVKISHATLCKIANFLLHNLQVTTRGAESPRRRALGWGVSSAKRADVTVACSPRFP